uniref:Period n=1 Tax=Hermissenda crassicornis TaxID=205593 RepID=A0A2Z4QKA5_HERCR|nr:period [Hermissenda crassicornis]
MDHPRIGKKSNRISSSNHLSPANWKSLNSRKQNANEHDQINSGYHELAIDETTTRDVRESSTSSLSLSFFSESDLAEAPSTSGCSSEMASVTHSKERKKEKAKEFMKKLKSMLPLKERKVKMDTLSTLEQVVNNMKRLSESQRRDSEFKSPHMYSGAYHSLDADKLQQSDMYISVSLKNHVVQTASSSLMTHLGYPTDWWKGRLLRDFLSKKDINTVNGCLAHFFKEEQEPRTLAGESSMAVTSTSNSQGSRYFFARIRRFRKLSEGFSIQNVVSYSPFVMTVTMARTSEHQTDSDKDGLGSSSDGRIKASLVVYCHPLTSAYTDATTLPFERQFSLRHSPSCKYTDVEPSAIALLGHLPQDFNGKSIFDLYHPDDYPKLLDIHRRVVQCKGKPFKTDRIRLKTRNNCFIELETEWSSFTNPWTTRLEFIIGQHTVVKGPNRHDVFEDIPPSVAVDSIELTANDRKTLEKIMEILQKPVQDVFTQPAPRPPIKDQVASLKRNISQVDTSDSKVKPVKEKPKVYCQAQDKGEKYTVLDEKGISSIYNQLNYSYNIKRFLMSHPKPFNSNVSDEDSTPEREGNGDDPIHADEEMPLELPVVKPSSCGSSTQVHVSEQGHGEEMMSPSAFDDEAVGQTAVVVPPKEVSADNIRVLTEESLKKHTKVQELLYLQKIAEEQPLLLNMRRIKRYQNPPQKRPWPRETSEEVDKAKHPYTNSGIFRSSSNIFMQSFPTVTSCNVTTASMPTPTPNQLFHQSRIVIPFTGQGVMASQPVQGLTTTAVINNPPIPLVTVNAPSMGPLIPTSIQAIRALRTGNTTGPQPMVSAIQPQNIQWPYYPQPGYTLLPQVMGGFYRPILQPVAVETPRQPDGVSVNVTKAANPLAPQPVRPATLTQREMPSNKDKASGFVVNRQEADPMISSGDDTGSSIMYLLEADSSTLFEDSDSKKGGAIIGSAPSKAAPRHKNMPCAEPPWLRGVKWNNNVKLRYEMPQSRLMPVLKKDEKMLKKCQQGDLTLESLEQLLEDISLPNNEEVFDEETDYLFFPKDQMMGDDEDDHMHMMEDLFTEVEMTMSNIMQEDDKEEGEHKRKGDDKGGGGGGGGKHRKKNTDNVIWEVQELESEEHQQEPQQQQEAASSTTAACHKEEAANASDSSNSTLGGDKEDKEMGSLIEETDAPSNESKPPETEMPAIETTEVYMPTAQVEVLNKRTSSSKESSLSGDEGSDGANKQETEDSQSNCSKLSSDITPSDERSNEEAGSSHKESNASEQHLKLHSPSSSGEQCSPEDDETMDESEMNENWDGFFQKLFTPLKVLVSRNPDNASMPASVPFWQSNAEMTQKVSMTYQIPKRSLEDVLQEDMRKLDRLSQSGTVKQQLVHLLTDSYSKMASTTSSTSQQTVPKPLPSTSSMCPMQEVLAAPSSHYFTHGSANLTSPPNSQSMETGVVSEATTSSIIIPNNKESVVRSPFKDNVESHSISHKITPPSQLQHIHLTDSELKTSSTSQKQSSHIATQGEQKEGEGGGSSDTNSDPVVGDSIPDSSASCSSSLSIAVNVEKQQSSSSLAGLAERANIDSFFHECFNALTNDAVPGTSIEDLIVSKVFVSDTGSINRAMKNLLCMPE